MIGGAFGRERDAPGGALKKPHPKCVSRYWIAPLTLGRGNCICSAALVKLRNCATRAKILMACK